jgi:hypothetical protein
VLGLGPPSNALLGIVPGRAAEKNQASQNKEGLGF